MKHTKIPAETKRNAIALHQKGLGYRTIAKMTMANASSVKYWLERFEKEGEKWLDNLERPAKRKKKAPDPLFLERLNEAVEACGRSLTPISTIAKKYGVPYGSLYYTLKKHPEVKKKREMLLDGPLD